MSRIVFAHQLRKTISTAETQRPFYANPRTWILLVLLNAALAMAVLMSWKPDSLWAIIFPPAKAYAITNNPSVAQAPGAAAPAKVQQHAPVAIPLDPQAQKAAQYIAKTYHIAKEASEIIVREAFKAGKENSVDPMLMLAIIGVESHFNPISESEAGALGLTQTMPEAHPEKVATIQQDQGHILNIADNIQLGTKVIGEYMRKFGNNPVLALQQYNGSLNDKSRNYSNKVLELKVKFSRASNAS